MKNYLIEILKKQKSGVTIGAVSACTANEYAIKATLKRAKKYRVPAIIEATANQVDQTGGYTGMTPRKFVCFVKQLAREMDYPENQIIFGGDHLGPLTKMKMRETEAMAFAEELVKEYVSAGFSKIHIDTSMRLGDDPQDQALSDEIIAERGARLCRVAEDSYRKYALNHSDCLEPVYVIGSEVPIPGGAQEHNEKLRVTSPENCRKTFEAYMDIFQKRGLEAAFSRIVAFVVQPGVEFGDEDIFQYNRQNAADLVHFGKKCMPFIFEGHSTDFQTKEALRAMVEDGIAFLKVGPALTFALREALFLLEAVEKEIYIGKTYFMSNFKEVLEMSMLNNPINWKNHYHGDSYRLKFSRKYSFSDRSRYYLPIPEVKNAIHQLLRNIDATERIPSPLLRQYFPREYESLNLIDNAVSAEELILEHIGLYLDDYYLAVIPK